MNVLILAAGYGTRLARGIDEDTRFVQILPIFAIFLDFVVTSSTKISIKWKLYPSEGSAKRTFTHWSEAPDSTLD